jgi:hypothetical protein
MDDDMNRRIAFGRRTTQKQGLAWVVDNFVKKFGFLFLFLVFKFYIWLSKYALHMKNLNKSRACVLAGK